MKRITVTLIPWKWAGIVVVGGTPKSFAKWAKTTYSAEVNILHDSIGLAFVVHDKPWLLWVKTLHNFPTLAHEALHITTSVLEQRGLVISTDSEEAVTYTMEYLLEQILTAKGWKTINARP